MNCIDSQTAYVGPERRAAVAKSGRHWSAHVVDLVDYGMLLLDEHARLVHANPAALESLDDTHPLTLQGNEVRSRSREGQAAVSNALAQAYRGLRSFLQLGDLHRPLSVAVVPAPVSQDDRPGAIMILGKRTVFQELSAQWFARSHGLTAAELDVLREVCVGSSPTEIAQRQGVAISTIRTHIGSIRAKTGASNMTALTRQVAMLPPIVSALRHDTPAAHAPAGAGAVALA